MNNTSTRYISKIDMAMRKNCEGVLRWTVRLMPALFIITTVYIVSRENKLQVSPGMFRNPDPLHGSYRWYRVNMTGFPSPKENETVDIPKLFQRFKDRQLEMCLRSRYVIAPRRWKNIPAIVQRFRTLRMNSKLVSSHVLGHLKCCSGAEKLKALEENIHASLIKLQNPANCTQAKRLLFTMTGHHGMGSTVHRLVRGLMLAFATNRTLVLDQSTFAYDENGWQQFIQPIGSCPVPTNEADAIGHDVNLSLIVRTTLGTFPKGVKSTFHPSIPRHILEEFQGLDCDPSAWWTAQFTRYVFRPQGQIAQEIQRKMESFRAPIAGVHIRRGDKLIRDAVLHKVEEYMDEVEKYFDELDLKQHYSDRKVYVATDDKTVIDEIEKKYPHYTVFSDRDHATAVTEGYTMTSLAGVIIDASMLSRTNFLVCTLSSNICRMSYELMVSGNSEECPEVRSLDCNYYFDKGRQIPHIANSDHTSSSEHEISFRKGDPIFSYGYVGEGYSAGINHNGSTDIVGVFPSHKVSTVYMPVG